MLMLGLVAIGTLAANGARQLRYTAIAFLAVALAAHLLAGPAITIAAHAVTLICATVIAGPASRCAASATARNAIAV